MTDSDKNALKQFEEKLRGLIYKYEQERESNESLTRRLKEQEDRIRELEMRNVALEKNYNNLKQAKVISLSDAEIGTTRERISMLVREIDRCIESLNKQ
ncbi:MAG: hypothetical protein IKV17_04935 [Bacteroidaceae bacterium]|nr:hypothetical protein [Bacteroidaceae bacterium]